MSTLELELIPANNQQLANLCGVLDQNLKYLEKLFTVNLRRRGSHITIQGDHSTLEDLSQTILELYAQSKQMLDPRDIDRLLTRINKTEQPSHSPLLLQRAEFNVRNEKQAQYLEQITQHVITFGVGPAGTGKTYLAVASAVDALERDQVRRIILVRPAVEAGEKLGFLPGDLSQKVDPYLRPLYDALYDLMGYEKVSRLFERNIIEIAPLAFMRGRTLNHSFIILDEAQNTTPEQMKMFLTRIGFGTKAVITGDVTQIDLNRHQKSGLIDARNVLSKVEGIAFTIFQTEDVVRHPLVQQIVNAYDMQAKTSHY
ncbi:MAG: phosphate starvation-inducible protein PhoH [Ferrovum sp. 37-45-19]|uniref:PhoH family protein n=1 Tax=Ferrovum sp. JA12 TaxID=1356299 RepID=UPI000703B311|nr:PhoH family protein [Ferrovum sp. JA12]OYV80419.1 MAG: phosphate starvation-inducible protein PhoH [Ferrovum sp. 21-44-67]OYV94734.1 MAG: phosphate starvation-inducible protein PhoH [Ferrovum sp. 37-45-19]OZB31872.1 MAG: phosphate starvation-inducible protein PhoH [Ferrovum sp. 34-44-207]HQT81150.1 PhoH family protein [Ferrovaceae bacterium]KRH79123.1 PhoH-like protein [Ferrovum sp. JA12]